MDKYRISGRNEIKNKNKINILEYYYEISYFQEKNKIYLEILDYRTNMWFLSFMKINILNIAQKMVLVYDDKKGIIGIENYEELKDNLKAGLILYEIKYPDTKEFIDYLRDNIEEERDFINILKSIDFIEFLFGGNSKKKIIRNFLGIDKDKSAEIQRIVTKENNIEKYNYEITETSLNLLKLEYVMNNEKVPKYYLEGKGEKIYDEKKLLSANLDIKSGREDEFKREISIKIEIMN